jgi:hypothetical protein
MTKSKYIVGYLYTQEECLHRNLETIGEGKACYDCGKGFNGDMFPLDYFGKPRCMCNCHRHGDGKCLDCVAGRHIYKLNQKERRK